ncbi:hypothetical protein METH109765_23020 [Mesobacillus thioparans]
MVVIYSFRTGTFARNIYLYGNERFTAREGFNGIPEEYHQPVKDYAAKQFTLMEIEKARINNWITQNEYEDTVLLRTESSPVSSEKI